MAQPNPVEDFLAAIRPFAERLCASGAKSEREKILALLNGGGVFAPPQVSVTPPRGDTPPQYGAVTKQVRDALGVLAKQRPQGVDAAAVHAECSNLTILQIRTALKQLARLGSAVRAARGSYLPAPDSGTDGEPGSDPRSPETTE